MANTTNTQLELGFIYSPLTVSAGISVLGNVPAVQQFDIATGVYTPHYPDINLVLGWWLEVVDPDGVLTVADKVLTNWKWFVIEEGVETLITSGGDSPYVIDNDLGTLTIQRNANPDAPLTFRCEADFQDARTGDVHHFVQTQQVIAESVGQRPTLKIDTPSAIRYDPVRDTTSIRKVKASFKIGETDVPAAQREFVWQKKDSDGVWADITLDSDDDHDIMDYDVSLNADKSELTIDCALVGKRIDIRVYAKYNPFGDPSAISIDDTTPVAECSVVLYEAAVKGEAAQGNRIFPTQKYIYPELKCKDSKGVIPNPDSVLDIKWKVSKGVASGAVTPGSVIATGSKPTIPTTSVVKLYGGTVVAEISVKEPLRAATSNGKILTYNGKVLLIR